MINEAIKNILACPACHKQLSFDEIALTCKECQKIYPVINGMPILIDESSSIFKIDDFYSGRATTIENRVSERSFLRKVWVKVAPNITLNISGRKNFKRFKDEVLSFVPKPVILVLGGSVLGSGIDQLVYDTKIILVETDVSFGARTQIICDAHAIPFAGNSIDGVVAQAVLEHVVDPDKCVGEIHRVLKLGGLVYSETSFMQQVHMGRYDFTRFTDLGHRRLFRGFEEIDRGVVAGPATALVWNIRYFLSSFTDSQILKKALNAISGIFTFWIKYLDYYLVNKKSAYDSASGFYFLGKKREGTLSDSEIIKLYRGPVRYR